ncbi:MAG TPA: hypothetical protein VLO07_03935 [Thermoanaerobaculia bacterium]|nr:hypothetical protein [Thermoanaerobaculia bacterium]
MSRTARVLLVVFLAAVLLPALASACPLCKDAKSDTDYPGGTASLPKGFYYSILLMVSAPFLVVGGLAFRIYLARRRLLALTSSVGSSTDSQPARRLVPDPRGARP